jgi:hypothetical protein
VSLTTDRLARYAGAYWDARTETLRRLAVREGALAMAAGGSWVPLVPLAADRFRLGAGATIVHFTAGPSGAPRLEEVGASGGRTVYERMPDPRATPADLAGLAGTYRSDELDATWRMEVVDGRLVVRRRALPDYPLEPAFADAFVAPAGLVHFTRDASGRASGFVIRAGRVTGFRFDRVSDR